VTADLETDITARSSREQILYVSKDRQHKLEGSTHETEVKDRQYKKIENRQHEKMGSTNRACREQTC
jgi:hypothetical protein